MTITKFFIFLVISCVIYFCIFWLDKPFTNKTSILNMLIEMFGRVFNKSKMIVKISGYENSGNFRQNISRDEIRMRMRTGNENLKDLMIEGPFDFLPNYRNPCWIAENTTPRPPIKCLPYFYLVGATKCGTTDLFSRIKQHPSVSSNTGKEPHWINRKYYWNDGATLDGYMRFFRATIKEIYQTKKGHNFHHMVFGDASASTLWDNEFWKGLPQYKNLSEPLYTNADYIHHLNLRTKIIVILRNPVDRNYTDTDYKHHLNPKTKTIVILRNPVDRLYSSYLYFRTKNKKTPQHFHEAVVEAMEYFNDCLVNHTLRYCVYCNRPTNDSNILKRRIVVGIYFVHLNEYFRVFPRRQIHVVKLEDYSKNISSALKELFHFLELEPLPRGKLSQIKKSGKKNTRPGIRRSVGEMLPQTRRLLEDFHRPYNKELVKILGKKFDYNN